MLFILICNLFGQVIFNTVIAIPPCGPELEINSILFYFSQKRFRSLDSDNYGRRFLIYSLFIDIHNYSWISVIRISDMHNSN